MDGRGQSTEQTEAVHGIVGGFWAAGLRTWPGDERLVHAAGAHTPAKAVVAGNELSV